MFVSCLIAVALASAAHAHLCTLAPAQRGGIDAGLNSHGAAECLVLSGPCGNTTAMHPAISIHSAVPVRGAVSPLRLVFSIFLSLSFCAVCCAPPAALCSACGAFLRGVHSGMHSTRWCFKRISTTSTRRTRARLSSIWLSRKTRSKRTLRCSSRLPIRTRRADTSTASRSTCQFATPKSKECCVFAVSFLFRKPLWVSICISSLCVCRWFSVCFFLFSFLCYI